MTPKPVRLFRIAAALITAGCCAVTAGCGWRGVNSLPLPGTQGGGAGAYTVAIELPDVTNLQRNARVRVGDVTVGRVTDIARQDWHAVVHVALDGDVVLPANATATVGQTSLLGSLHVELAPPAAIAPQGRLHNGSVIPLTSAGAYPTTEQTLSAVSLLLNNGGIGKVQDITEALSTAFTGRENALRDLLSQLDTFTAHLQSQTDDILAATDSLNDLVRQFADAKPTVDRALKVLPDALAVLSAQRDHLAEAATKLGQLSALVAEVIQRSGANLTREVTQLGPVAASLADAGPALTRSLSMLLTFPWPNETLQNFIRGDYANLTGIFDLTLSRLDQGLLTGTRFEGKLTELEMQWGRTIGQFPSPYNQGNPLTIPYHWDQGP